MDKFEVRRLNLRALIRTRCEGRAAALADKIGRSASYVSRLLYPEGKDGMKRMGEDMRDLIEESFSLPKGSLDDAAAAQVELAGGLQGTEQAQASGSSSAGANSDSLIPSETADHSDENEPYSAASLAGALELRAETAAELRLLSIYRLANDREREAIDDRVNEMSARIERRTANKTQRAG